MSPYKTTDTTPPTPEYCTTERRDKLHEAGFTTDGHIDHLRQIITENGFPLPSQEVEHWGFIFRTAQKKDEKEHVFTRLYLTEVDACAELILMLKKFGMI